MVKECGICFETFEETDEVVECIMVHAFHTNCFEGNKENESDVKCPTCHNPMKLAVADPTLRHTAAVDTGNTSLLGTNLKRSSTVNIPATITDRSSLNDSPINLLPKQDNAD